MKQWHALATDAETKFSKIQGHSFKEDNINFLSVVPVTSLRVHSQALHAGSPDPQALGFRMQEAAWYLVHFFLDYNNCQQSPQKTDASTQ